MKLNTKTLTALREAKGMTQQDVADKSDLTVRTVQRAEAGEPVDKQTLALIAATLGVPNADLIDSPQSDNGTDAEAYVCVLQPVRNPLDVITALRSHQGADLDCIVETTPKGRAEAVIEFLSAVEEHIPSLTPDPKDEPHPPSIAKQLRARIEFEQKLNHSLLSLKSAGLQLYIGTFTSMQVVPYYSFDDGCWVYSNRANPEPVRIAVLRIADSGQNRLAITMKRSMT